MLHRLLLKPRQHELEPSFVTFYLICKLDGSLDGFIMHVIRMSDCTSREWINFQYQAQNRQIVLNSADNNLIIS